MRSPTGLTSAFESYRLVTLVGMGGIGKTSLALAVARRLSPRDGWLVELATVQAPTDVPRAVAEVLGVKERQGTDLTDRIVEHLRSRRALLILDNCEHVVDAVADLVATVMRGLSGRPNPGHVAGAPRHHGRAGHHCAATADRRSRAAVRRAGRCDRLVVRFRGSAGSSGGDLRTTRRHSAGHRARIRAGGEHGHRRLAPTAQPTDARPRRLSAQRHRTASHLVVSHLLVVRPADPRGAQGVQLPRCLHRTFRPGRRRMGGRRGRHRRRGECRGSPRRAVPGGGRVRPTGQTLPTAGAGPGVRQGAARGRRDRGSAGRTARSLVLVRGRRHPPAVAGLAGGRGGCPTRGALAQPPRGLRLGVCERAP